MSTDNVLDRLQICNKEIAGIVRSFRAQPTKPSMTQDLPLIYIRPMGMTKDVPQTGAGQYIVYRRFMLVIVVGITTLASLDTSDEGSKLLADCSSMIDPPLNYYMNHPRLHTEAGLPELDEIEEDTHYIDAGPEMFQGIDGKNWAGIRPIITIAERRISKRLS